MLAHSSPTPTDSRLTVCRDGDIKLCLTEEEFSAAMLRRRGGACQRPPAVNSKRHSQLDQLLNFRGHQSRVCRRHDEIACLLATYSTTPMSSGRRDNMEGSGGEAPRKSAYFEARTTRYIDWGYDGAKLSIRLPIWAFSWSAARCDKRRRSTYRRL